jgi:hypothetical protein
LHQFNAGVPKPPQRWQAVEQMPRLFMATSLLPSDCKGFLRLLSSKLVEYLLIGGYAVGYYGYAQATADRDVGIATALEDLS